MSEHAGSEFGLFYDNTSGYDKGPEYLWEKFCKNSNTKVCSFLQWRGRTAGVVTNMIRRGMKDTDIITLAECEQYLVDEIRKELE